MLTEQSELTVQECIVHCTECDFSTVVTSEEEAEEIENEHTSSRVFGSSCGPCVVLKLF